MGEATTSEIRTKACTNPACRSGGEPLPVSMFYPHKTSPSGFRPRCKECESAKHRTKKKGKKPVVQKTESNRGRVRPKRDFRGLDVMNQLHEKRRKKIVIVCEELNMIWDDPDLLRIKQMLLEKATLDDICVEFDGEYDRDELIIALIHLIRRGYIKGTLKDYLKF